MGPRGPVFYPSALELPSLQACDPPSPTGPASLAAPPLEENEDPMEEEALLPTLEEVARLTNTAYSKSSGEASSMLVLLSGCLALPWLVVGTRAIGDLKAA